MDYGNILKKTWQAVWGHKAILGFGLAMTLLLGLFSVLLLGFVFYSPWLGFEQIEQWLTGNAIVFIGFNLLFSLFSIMITALGYAGVLKGMVQAEKGAADITFLDLWIGSWPYVLRILGITLLIGFGISSLVVLPTLLGFVTAGLGFLCVTPFLCLIMPLTLLGQLVIDLGMSAIVADELGVFAAIRSAWLVVRRNPGPVAVMVLILYLVQVGLTMIMVLPLSFVQGLVAYPLAQRASDLETSLRALGTVLLILLPFALLIQGALQTYVKSAWMLVYLRLRPAPSGELQYTQNQE